MAGKLLAVFVTASLPVSEVRGAIPYGILVQKLPWHLVIPVAYVANFTVTFLFYLLLETIEKFLKKFELGHRFLNWFFNRTRKRSKIVEELETIGLIIFVAIPLPFTGAWTGATAAYLLGIKPAKTALALAVGVAIATAAVTVLVLTGKMVF